MTDRQWVVAPRFVLTTRQPPLCQRVEKRNVRRNGEKVQRHGQRASPVKRASRICSDSAKSGGVDK